MMNGLAIKNLAHAIAVVAHDGHSRKGLGEPYINHVERVADSIYGWQGKSAAYLHDVVEDTNITLDDLRKIGIPANIVDAVNILSRIDGVSYSDFIDRVIDNENIEFHGFSVIQIKIADINDNLRDIDDINKPSLKIRYMKALAKLESALLES